MFIAYTFFKFTHTCPLNKYVVAFVLRKWKTTIKIQSVHIYGYLMVTLTTLTLYIGIFSNFGAVWVSLYMDIQCQFCKISICPCKLVAACALGKSDLFSWYDLSNACGLSNISCLMVAIVCCLKQFERELIGCNVYTVKYGRRQGTHAVLVLLFIYWNCGWWPNRQTGFQNHSFCLMWKVSHSSYMFGRLLMYSCSFRLMQGIIAIVCTTLC